MNGRRKISTRKSLTGVEWLIKPRRKVGQIRSSQSNVGKCCKKQGHGRKAALVRTCRGHRNR